MLHSLLIRNLVCDVYKNITLDLRPRSFHHNSDREKSAILAREENCHVIFGPRLLLFTGPQNCYIG